ncbi:MAG: ABC transporter ATP-binding protein [Thermoplasmata archaeon]
MLKINNLVCGYGDLDIIRGVSFDIEDNQVKVLLSLNGGGKTTLLKSLSGLIQPKEGTISLDGKDITNASPRERAKSGMLYIPEWGIFPNLSVRENLIIASSNREKSNNFDISSVVSRFTELKERMFEKAASLSGGQRKILMLAMAVASGSKLFLLDEPSSGLSPAFVDRVLDTIKQLKEDGMTFLIAEQNPSFSEISDEIMILDLGKIISRGKYEELRKNDEIRKKFFSL